MQRKLRNAAKQLAKLRCIEDRLHLSDVIGVSGIRITGVTYVDLLSLGEDHKIEDAR